MRARWSIASVRVTLAAYTLRYTNVHTNVTSVSSDQVSMRVKIAFAEKKETLSFDKYCIRSSMPIEFRVMRGPKPTVLSPVQNRISILLIAQSIFRILKQSNTKTNNERLSHQFQIQEPVSILTPSNGYAYGASNNRMPR